MLVAAVIGAGDGGELVGGDVGGRALAPGEQVEPGRGDVGEQGRGPAAPVKAHRHPAALADDLPQLGEQPAQLPGQRVRRLGDHHEHRLPVLAGDPGLPGGRGRELQPRDVGLLHGPGAVVDAGVPVHVQEPQRLGAAGSVPAGQRHDQVRGLAGRGELAELAADRLDLRRPVQPQHPAQRRGRHPRGALGPRLPGQRQEHQRQQRGGQPVEPVLEPAVHLFGGIQQAGALQGRQRQQQSSQRIPGTGGEHRLGALAEQPPPGQRPLPVPGNRVRQHRNRRARALVIVPRDQAGAVCDGTGRRVLPAGGDPAQRVAHAERRHPGRRGDLAQGRPRRVQFPDPRCQLRGQLRGPLRAPPRGNQPGHPARRQRLIPPPHRDRIHPERRRGLRLADRPQPDQLHRRQPPARVIPRIPGERGQPVHRHQPAAIIASDQPDPRRELGGPGGQQRQRQLGQHPRHHPPHPTWPCHCINFLRKGSAKTPRHAGKRTEKKQLVQARARSGPNHNPSASRHVRSPEHRTELRLLALPGLSPSGDCKRALMRFWLSRPIWGCQPIYAALYAQQICHGWIILKSQWRYWVASYGIPWSES